jgi:quinol monooxygenase YgiN
MASARTEIAICRYRTKPGKEKEFIALLERHWPTLHRLGLVTDEPAQLYRGLPPGPGEDKDAVGASTFVELFSWRDAEAVDTAHHSPEVMRIWEPMGAICESMEFPHFERLALPK